MFKKALSAGRRISWILLSGSLGAAVVLVVLGVVTLNNQPDLKIWHKAVLDEEFTAGSGITDFGQYLALEDRLFEQLDLLIYQKIESADQRAINRYFKGSLSDPGRWPVNWNRSFVMPVNEPATGVLLLHGMSDSPYSLRSIGQLLHGRGAYVIGLRVPGHGQAPSGLLDVEWEDMAAAVRLAMIELRQKSAGKPLYIVGYSNGGALAVLHTLESLADESMVTADGLVLLSPEIGISKLAALAKWQERLGHLLGLEKLAWNTVQPEYDPWKYGSFALNAGKQAYRITQEIQKQISRQSAAGVLHKLPPILAFQSVVDATVTAPALVENLFARIPAIASDRVDFNRRQHELVLFDINRWTEIDPLMKENPSAWINPMLQNGNANFVLTLMSNQDRQNKHLSAFSRLPGATEVETCETGLVWPEDIYSLSHVALPFPPDDPVYGVVESGPRPGIDLGDIALRGERGMLHVPAADMLRLRYNPFFSYLEQRTLVFMGLEPAPDRFCLPAKSGSESQ